MDTPGDHPTAYWSPTLGYIVSADRRLLDQGPPLITVSDSHVVRELPDDAIELIPALLQDHQYHKYVSTYCQHGEHGDCRLTCKVCGAPCRCKTCGWLDLVNP